MKSYRVGPETDRLTQRSLVASDAERFYELNCHPEVGRFTGEAPIPSVEEARRAIAEYPDWDTVGYGRWGCVLKGEDSICGFCGLKYLEDLDVVDLGYRFFPEYWGKGLATEACRASVQFGFEVIGLEYIAAFVLPENRASIRVLEKIGMQCEGEVIDGELRPLRFGLHRG